MDRRQPFLPAAILGNGSLLVTLSARGEVERLFWPNVDHGQHLGELRLGIERDGETRWLDEEPFAWRQEYVEGASILRTVARDEADEAEFVDLVLPDEPVLVRRVRCSPAGGRLVLSCRPCLDESRYHDAGYLDPESGALVFYRRHVALALALVPESRSDAAVHSPAEDRDGRVDGTVAHVAPIVGTLAGGPDGETLVLAAFGTTPAQALARLERPARAGFEALEAQRRDHDRAELARSRRPSLSLPGLDGLYDRSVMALGLLTDRETGATIAAPEFDPGFTESGGYGFVWPRDLAYVVLAFLAAGRGDLAVPALRWLARTQAPEGLWLQRHWTDGSLGPCWSLHQVDETGAALFAYEAAWRELGDEALDRELWPSARAGAEFLLSFTDPATGLPLPSVDLWEQHDGQASYSAAAVYGGLAAAAGMAARHEPELAGRYLAGAESVRAAIEAHLWSDEHGRYVRSLWVGRGDTGGEPVPPIFERRLPYPNRAVRSVDRVDVRVDSSLLGLAWPFRAVDPASPRMRATVAALERELLLPDGGILRFEGDHYAGGNPWLIATLWLGLYYRQVGDGDGVRRCVEYALARQTELGLLPEQVTRDGRVAWVLPLAWSHAMLLLAAAPELAIVRG